MLQRGNSQPAMPFQFFANRRATGEFFPSIDMHGAGPANRRTAGIPQRQAAIELVLDPDEHLEHSGATPHVETHLLIVRARILFGIESLQGNRKTHRTLSACGRQPSAS